jgi:hypothetical protein
VYSLKYLHTIKIVPLKDTIRDSQPDGSGISSLAAAIPLRRHDSQPEGWKAHHSIHSFAFDLSTSYLGAQLSLDILLILVLTHCLFSFPSLPGLLT